MTPAGRLRVALAFGCLVGGGACVFPHQVGLTGPVGASCPTSLLPPARNTPPDTTRLRWYRPSDDDDRSRGDLACDAIGPPVYRELPTAGFAGWAVGDSVTVASWNADRGTGDLARFLDEELGLSCDAEASSLRGAAPAFVLLLQEVVRHRGGGAGETRGIGVVDVADRCGLAIHYVPSVSLDDRGASDRGAAVLATLPLGIPVAIELPYEAERSVVVAATVRLPGGDRLRLASARIDGSAGLARLLVTGNQTRSRQARGLIDGLNRADDDGPLNAATVLGIDTGAWDDNETTLRLLRVAFPESPAWDGRMTRGAFSADHLFFRRGSFRTITLGLYRRTDDAYGSAHFGRTAVLNHAPVRSPPPAR